MDALTHLAAPAACACLLRGRRRDVLHAGIGGLLPDIEKPVELVMQFVPGGDYLLFQHGGTHSIAGTLLVATGGALWMRGGRLRGGAFLLLGTVAHVLLDGIVDPRGFLPFLPFSAERVALHWSPGAPVTNALTLAVSVAVLAIAAFRSRRGTGGFVDRGEGGT